MRVLHLSDLHLRREPGPDDHGLDARAVLAQLLHDCRRLPDLDLVAISGDVADDGAQESYVDALALVGRFARDRGAAQVWCTGNHDDRDAFAAVLGSGHLDSSGRDVGRLAPSSTGERTATSNVAGVRVITLDSLVPGQVAGRVSTGQLDWLRELLAEPTPGGSVVALHHPPLSVSPQWAAASLQDPQELAEVLSGSDVRAVLCGHVHAQLTGFLEGVPVWVGPGVVTRVDLTAPPTVVRAVRGAAATVVDLAHPCAPLFHVVHARDLRAGQEVFVADSSTWQYVTGEQEADR